MNYVSAEEAVAVVQSGHRVYLHGAAATPNILVNALVERYESLKDVEICHVHTEGPAKYVHEPYCQSFHVNNFFIGENVRPFISTGNAQYVPIFLSEIPYLFRRKILPIDVVMINVSPPDRHGYCSLGVSVEATLAAVETAKYIIAQINDQMPRTQGDGNIHISKIHKAVQVSEAIHAVKLPALSEDEARIGKYIAEIIEDGSCLQMGIGAIPNAVLSQMTGHKNLGVHTEMFSDGIIPLVKSGVINGSNKKNNRNKIVTSFMLGSKALYDFVDENPILRMKDAAYVNDTANIRKNKKVVAINSAIEIDLTGQVCADSIGTRMYSGVGGQMDFMRGASLSEGGKPIIAMTSMTAKGMSKIVPFLKQGAGVVSTRGHVHYIATEYGIADLYGKNLAQRAKALIGIAHPDVRESLEKYAYELYGKVW
ncbi:MAG: acetyl-CoA hydrolase/transferase family protein [Saprospiraceae bacterium]|nr:acetyl-CoA hydrolase/transferase family protein [Saprospiraceae bacterium]